MTGKYATFTDTVKLSATVAAHRFVTKAGAYPSANGAAYAVTRTAGVSGDLVACDANGSTMVEAGAAIAVDAACKVDGTGRVVTHDSTNVKVGRALTAAAQAGDLIELALIPNA